MSTAMDEMWGPEEEQALLDTIDAWVEKSVAPIAREYDLEDKYPHQLVEEMKDLGLFGATISTEYGGLGLPARIYAKIVIKNELGVALTSGTVYTAEITGASA